MENRHIARPAIAEGRLSLTGLGQVCYTLKTPCRDGTTHVVFEPLDFVARRAAITPAGRVSRRAATESRTPAERHRAKGGAA